MYECVSVQSCEMRKTHFLPYSPHPFWPYSSALQRHKWRRLVSCRRDKGENYNEEMEITDLQLNDNRGSATSEHTDRDDGSASKENRQGKQNLFLPTPFCTKVRLLHWNIHHSKKQRCPFRSYICLIRAANNTVTEEVAFEGNVNVHLQLLAMQRLMQRCLWVYDDDMFADPPEPLVLQPLCHFCNTLNTAHVWVESTSTQLIYTINSMFVLTVFQPVVTPCIIYRSIQTIYT